jgi:radical SAM superfamily enzyme YgiQ (UPF0313 family)
VCHNAAVAASSNRALLVSTYEMGRQPFGLASPAAWLRAAGWDVECADLSKARLGEQSVTRAGLIGFYLPMHTATRLAQPVIAAVRRLNPAARLCAYGLYAPPNAAALQSLGIDAVFGGEFEAALTEYATKTASRATHPIFRSAADALPRLRFLVPDRSTLPPLDRYATLQRPDGTRALVGYTEASRGCRHLCRHCPVVPIYAGRFRVVQPDVVLADIANQIAAGAAHITFGDPDFFNGPTHAMRIVDRLHRTHPAVSYDVTIKVEHLLRHRRLLPRLRETGCVFVTTAAESIDDRVLALLEKGHTRRDFLEAVAACADVGLTLAPTFVAFHPWITLDGYLELLETIEALDLVEQVAPVQLALRLLIPRGSRLLELEDVRRVVGPFDPLTLTYRWSHADPGVDRLQEDVTALVGRRLTGSRREVFDRIRERLRLDRPEPARAATKPARDRATVPYLNEPWYC